MRAVIIVEGGLVQEVHADKTLEYIIIDKDSCDEDVACELQDMTGDTFTASLTEYETEASREVEHYYKQIPAI